MNPVGSGRRRVIEQPREDAECLTTGAPGKWFGKKTVASAAEPMDIDVDVMSGAAVQAFHRRRAMLYLVLA